MTNRIMYDAIHDNVSALKSMAPTMAALYLTGGPSIEWTNADVAELPTVKSYVRIDQGGAGSPRYDANVQDVESGAYTVAQIPGWIAKCTAARPTTYCTRDTLPDVPSESKAIWLAAPGLSVSEAVALAATDERIVAVQNFWGSTYDTSVVVDAYWPAPDPSKPVPPGAVSVTPQATVCQGNLAWTGSGPFEIQIERLTTKGWVLEQTLTSNSNVITARDLSPRCDYRFRVSNYRAWSDWVAFTTPLRSKRTLMPWNDING